MWSTGQIGLYPRRITVGTSMNRATERSRTNNFAFIAAAMLTTQTRWIVDVHIDAKSTLSLSFSGDMHVAVVIFWLISG